MDCVYVALIVFLLFLFIYTSKCHCLIRSTAAVKLKITNELI